MFVSSMLFVAIAAVMKYSLILASFIIVVLAALIAITVFEVAKLFHSKQTRQYHIVNILAFGLILFYVFYRNIVVGIFDQNIVFVLFTHFVTFIVFMASTILVTCSLIKLMHYVDKVLDLDD